MISSAELCSPEKVVATFLFPPLPPVHYSFLKHCLLHLNWAHGLWISDIMSSTELWVHFIILLSPIWGHVGLLLLHKSCKAILLRKDNFRFIVVAKCHLMQRQVLQYSQFRKFVYTILTTDHNKSFSSTSIHSCVGFRVSKTKVRKYCVHLTC